MSFLSLVNSYEDAWKAVIMPPRQEYTLSNLGPTEFHVRNNRIQRLDFKIQNRRGYIIECSFYEQSYIEGPCPCVIYLHGSGCSRVEALQYVDLILGQPVSLFTFDFTASGKSEGMYSSVGWFEQDDLDCVINFLYGTGKVTKLCLWGRSMGATTALLYSAKYPQIECLILDSAFSHFKKLIKEIANKKASIPGFLTGSAYNMIRKTIQTKAGFDIEELKPIDHVESIKLPALFGVAKDDDFVLPKHTKNLYDAYLGQKNLVIFDGDHNSLRPPQWLLAVQGFIRDNLLGKDYKTPQESPEGSPLKKEMPKKIQSLAGRPGDLTAQNLNSARKSNDNSPLRRVHPRSMHFSWLSNKNIAAAQKSQMQLNKVENLTTIEDKLAAEKETEREKKPAGSPPKKGLRTRGNTATATTANTVTKFSESSYRNDGSKMFTDIYFTTNTAIKSEADEPLNHEKEVISHQTWQLGSNRMMGPKLASTNPDDDKALSSREAGRARVSGGSELMRSLSMSSKSWAATVIANEINKMNKASVGNTPIHDPSPTTVFSAEVNKISKVPLRDFSPQVYTSDIHKMSKASVGNTPVNDPSPMKQEVPVKKYDPMVAARNWLNIQPVQQSTTASSSSANHSFTAATIDKEPPQLIPGHRKRGTNLSGTFLPGTLKIGDSSPNNDYFPRSMNFEKISSAKNALPSTSSGVNNPIVGGNPTPSLGVSHNSTQVQPKSDLSPSYTYTQHGPNVYSHLTGTTANINQVTSPSVSAVMRSYLGVDSNPYPHQSASFTEATYKSYLNSSPQQTYGFEYKPPVTLNVPVQQHQTKSYEEKLNSLLSYKDYEIPTVSVNLADKKISSASTADLYGYLPQSNYAHTHKAI